MDYPVSARKYRPGTFGEVLGQPHVVQTLVNAITGRRIAQAFLFSGTRGVGKTTVARILAKALNCEHGPTSNPCDTCPNCLEITQGTSMDVIEIDGASNTGVDDVRQIRENVKFVPFRGKYRVYIIDEVHMLSNSAFNALLKTLEEPPPHVVFIFATTEIHKIPLTILSRCQHYNFRRIPRSEMIHRLRHVAEREGIAVGDQSLATIARASEGSLRDALSLLDQAVAFCGRTVSQASLETLLGAVPQEHVRSLIDAIIHHDSAAAVGVVANLLDQGHDLRAYCADVVEHIRNMLVAAAVPASSSLGGAGDLKVLKGLIELSEEAIRQVIADAQVFSFEHLQDLFRIFSQAEDALRLSAHRRFVLEVAAIRATRVRSTRTQTPSSQEPAGSPSPPTLIQSPQAGPGQKAASLVRAEPSAPDQNDQHRGKAGSNPSQSSPAPRASLGKQVADSNIQARPLERPASPAKAKGEEPATGVTPSPQDSAPFTWEEILERTDSLHPSLGSFLAQGTLVGIENGLVRIGYPKNASVARTRVGKPETLKVLNEICTELAGRPVQLLIEELPEGQTTTKPSMAQLRAAKQQNQKEALLAYVRSHPLVKQAHELFGAEVIEVRQPDPQENARS